MNTSMNAAPRHRGLQLAEGLLYEQSSPGRCGVDLPPIPTPRTLRTGLPARATIGLPMVAEAQVVRHFCAAITTELQH